MRLRPPHLIPSLAVGLLVACGSTAPMNGNPVKTGTAGTMGGSAGTGGGAGFSGACAAEASEPNDTPERAKVLTPGNDRVYPTSYGCVSAATDADLYELTLPADAPNFSYRAGGYYSVRVKWVGAGLADLKIFARGDAAEIQHVQASTAGEWVTAYFAAAPGQKYQVAVGSASAFVAPFQYGLELVDWPAEDVYEPNDTLETATPLAAQSGPIGLLLFTGHRSSKIGLDQYYDFFKVDVGGNASTVDLLNVPPDVQAEITLLDATGAELRRITGSGPGASITKEKAPDSLKYVRVGVAAAPVAAGPGTAIPAHFKNNAVLQITQP
jgi:hypothetical protein